MKDKLTAVCYILGIILLVAAFRIWRANRDQGITGYVIDRPFDMHAFLNSEATLWARNQKPEDLKNILLIYVTNVASCSDCMAEIAGFRNMIREDPLLGSLISQVACVADDDMNRLRTFVRVTDFKMPCFYMLTPEIPEAFDFLHAGLERMLFFNIQSGRFFYYAKLHSRLTPAEQKADFLAGLMEVYKEQK